MYYVIADGKVVDQKHALEEAREALGHAFGAGAQDVMVCKMILRTYSLAAANVVVQNDFTPVEPAEVRADWAARAKQS